MVSTSNLLLIGGGLGAGFFLLTDIGRDIIEDVAGIDVEDFFEDTLGIDFEIELEELLGLKKKGRGGGGGKRGRRQQQEAVADNDRGDPSLHNDPRYHFPIQDLYIPPRYYDVKHEIDTNRIPSKEFWDWYQKGSAGYLQDYYIPPHHWWNPDYYYFFGNLYKKWYPNVYDVRDYIPWKPADPLQGYYTNIRPQRQYNLEVRPVWEDDPTYS